MARLGCKVLLVSGADPKVLRGQSTVVGLTLLDASPHRFHGD
jgi:hypothetical protein